jgi:hypothetical protein
MLRPLTHWVEHHTTILYIDSAEEVVSLLEVEAETEEPECIFRVFTVSLISFGVAK